MVNKDIGIRRALSLIENNEIYSTDKVLKAIRADNIKAKIVSLDTELEEEIKKGLNSPVSALSHKEVFQSFRAQYAEN